MKKYISKLTFAIVVALVASLSIAIPAMAEPEPETAAQAAITRKIDAPPGTTIPEATFIFSFEQMARDRETGELTTMTADSPSMVNPPLSTSVSFAAGADPMAQSEDFLADVNWPHAGDFIFIVSENAEKSADENTFAANEHMKYSEKKFVVVVSVRNSDEGLIPTGVFAILGSPEVLPGESNPGSKIIPTPGIPGQPGTYSKLQFEGIFTRDIIGTLSNPALAITKNVEGEFANLILPFEFEAVLTIPGQALDRGEPFKLDDPAVATILNAAGQTVRTVPIEGTLPNLTISFSLSHGQRLVIPRLPAGTSFTVKEIQEPEYEGKLNVVIAGVPIGEPYTVEVGADIEMSSPRNISDAGRNAAEFTNIHNHSPLTGLVIGSMPVLAIIIGATVVLSMMVASRSRQRIEHMSLVQ